MQPLHSAGLCVRTGLGTTTRGQQQIKFNVLETRERQHSKLAFAFCICCLSCVKESALVVPSEEPCPPISSVLLKKGLSNTISGLKPFKEINTYFLYSLECIRYVLKFLLLSLLNEEVT